MDNNITNAIINSIKETIRKDLDYKLEAKRNDVVRSALNGIDISIMEQQPYSFEPVIQIKIEKKIILKGE